MIYTTSLFEIGGDYDIMPWKCFHYQPFVMGNLLDTPHKGPVMQLLDVFFDINS